MDARYHTFCVWRLKMIALSLVNVILRRPKRETTAGSRLKILSKPETRDHADMPAAMKFLRMPR